MIDVILLRILKHRKDYSILSPLVKPDVIDPVTRELIVDFGKYFEAFPSHEKIDAVTFITQFQHWHKGITPERVNEYGRVIANCMPDADDDQKGFIMGQLADQDLIVKLASFVEQFKEGETGDVMLAVSDIFDKYRISKGVKLVKFIDTPIRELLKVDLNNEGLKWRLHCLNDAMRPLRPGDFGIIAARPDKGKTSFIASEASYMAPQLEPERNVLWLNNEGPGGRIIPRVWQAVLNLKIPEMIELDRQNLLEPEFLKIMGRFDKLRVIDIHGLNNAQVEMLIDSNNAGLVIYDMIDNIGGFGESARTDSRLEAMYQWARERAVKYGAVGLATSQISAEGDGLQYPTLSMLKDSKTGKQGACDFQLMIGASNDPNLMSARFMGLPKNKLQKPDRPKDPRAEVFFDSYRSRFVDQPLNPSEVGTNVGN